MWNGKGLRRYKSMFCEDVKTETKTKTWRNFSFGSRDRSRIVTTQEDTTPRDENNKHNIKRTLSLRVDMQTNQVIVIVIIIRLS